MIMQHLDRDVYTSVQSLSSCHWPYFQTYAGTLPFHFSQYFIQAEKLNIMYKLRCELIQVCIV